MEIKILRAFLLSSPHPYTVISKTPKDLSSTGDTSTKAVASGLGPKP